MPVRDVLHYTPDFSVLGFSQEPEDMRVFVVMYSYEPLYDNSYSLSGRKAGSLRYPRVDTAEAFIDLVQHLIEVCRAPLVFILVGL